MGYAMMAGNVPDGAVTAAKLAGGAVTLDKLANDVKAGLLNSPSSGSTVFSEDSNATNLLAAGYVKLPGLRLLAEEWESLGAPTNVQFNSMARSPIWTGSEAYVFRADTSQGPLAMRYDPVSDIWHTLSTNDLPAITSFTPVWIGSELMILTSTAGSSLWAARYDPTTEAWHSVNTIGAPSFNTMDSVVFWTGTEVIVMSFAGPSAKRYRPSTDTWVSLNTNGAPFIGGPGIQVAAWTGTELILRSSMQLARYNPGSDTWPGINTNGMPVLSSESKVIWCGNTLVVLTNNAGNPLGGGRYSPLLNSWQPVSTNGAPSFYLNISTETLWTGSELIVFRPDSAAGQSRGSLYNPASNTWRVMNPAFPGYSYMMPDTDVIWTGTEMVVGPVVTSPTTPSASGRYNPATDRWLYIAPSPVNLMTRLPGIWTGTQVLVFGADMPTPSGNQFVVKWTPSPTLYLYQKP